MAIGSIGGTISWPKDTQIHSKVECEITNKTNIFFFYVFIYVWPGSRAASETTKRGAGKPERKNGEVDSIAEMETRRKNKPKLDLVCCLEQAGQRQLCTTSSRRN